MAEIKLMITAQSKNLTDELDWHIYELSMNGLEIYPKREDFPMPFDAGCYIEDGFFIIDGDLGQQGSNKSWAKVGIPLEKVQQYLDISVYPKDEESAEELRQIFTEYGWL